MTTNDTPNVLIEDGFGSLLRHKMAFLGGFLGIAALVVLLLVLRDPHYASESKLFVRVGRESVGLDPTAETAHTLTLHPSRQTEINSVGELIRSREIIEKTVDQIGPDVILATGPGLGARFWNLVGGFKTSLLDKFREPVSDPVMAESIHRNEAVRAVAANITVTVPEFSSVVSLSSRSHSPELAQKIVQTMVDVYLKEHVRIHRTPGSERFFREQADLLRKQLNDLRTRLNELKAERGIGTIEAQFTLLEAKKSQLEAMRVDNLAAVEAAVANVAAIQSALDGMEPTIPVQRTEGSGAATNGMRQQLYNLEIQERALVAQNRETHPSVVRIRKQLADVRKILESEPEIDSRLTTYGIDPAWQKLKTDLLSEQARMAGLKATGQSISTQLQGVVKQLDRLNADSLAYEDLSREIDLTEASYKNYTENLEQTRIDNELQRQQITNVNIVQPATLVPRPIGLSRSVLAGLGGLLAIFGGIGAALAAEHLDKSLRTPPNVERALGTPVVVSIPRGQSHLDKKLERTIYDGRYVKN